MHEAWAMILGMKYVLILVACLLLGNGGDIYRYFSSGPVGWAINKKIRFQDKREIVIADLTDFAWDELVVFGAYSRQVEICNRLKLDEHDCATKIQAEPNNDGLALLVFLRDKQVVHTETHLGWHGEFDVDDSRTWTPGTAIFRVEEDGRLYSGAPRYHLKPKT